MNLTSRLWVTAQQTFASTAYTSSTSPSDPPYVLGQAAYGRDGTVFHYCQAGASALVAGNVIQSPAQIANHLNMAPSATVAVGATTMTLTPGATGGAANLYQDGTLIVSTTPGLGQTFRVRSHAAITASTAFDIFLYSDDAVAVQLTTTSRLDLQQNVYKGVIQAPVTTLTGAIVGVAPYAIAATEYGWLQTWGPCGVLIDGTPAVGMAVSSPAAVAGGAAINSSTLTMLGDMLVTGVDTKVKAVCLKIAA
jgi:hypothetical protein